MNGYVTRPKYRSELHDRATAIAFSVEGMDSSSPEIGTPRHGYTKLHEQLAYPTDGLLSWHPKEGLPCLSASSSNHLHLAILSDSAPVNHEVLFTSGALH